jgi:hypothetical protein
MNWSISTIHTAKYRYAEWENRRGGAELSEHASDPQEMVNRAGSSTYADIVARLSKLLHARIAEARRPPPGIEQIRIHEARGF